MNRCLTEGRRAFVERLAGIQGGTECERLVPLVSLLADGELGGEVLRRLRPHLRSCLACRQRLREYREAPARVAAVLPAQSVACPLKGKLSATLATIAPRSLSCGAIARSTSRRVTQ